MFVYSTDAIDVLRIARLGHIYEKKCWFPVPKRTHKIQTYSNKNSVVLEKNYLYHVHCSFKPVFFILETNNLLAI